MTRAVPWWVKLGVKLAAGAARLPHHWRNRLGFDRHGAMQDPEYAIGVVQHHLNATEQLGRPFRGLELGPGDSLLSGLIAAAFGATEMLLVDVGAFATYDPDGYARTHRRLHELGHDPPGPPRLDGQDAFLARLNTRYLTDGLASLRSIPSESVDIVWSHAVLEHIRLADFDPIMLELHRVLAPGGRMSHVVDLLDHMDLGFNNLRFTSRVWERPAVWRSGAYTNRLSAAQILASVQAVGFRAAITTTRPRPLPAALRRTLAAEFRDRSDAELAIAGFDLLASRPD